MTRIRWGTARHGLGAGMVLFFFAAAGCDPGTGSLSGTVTYKGKALPGGMLSVATPDGRVAASKIGEDGSYAIANAPAGTLKITIITQPPLAGMEFPRGGGLRPEPGKQAPYAPLGKYEPIPARYKDPATSGLSCTVSKGKDTTYNITLEP